MLSRHHTHTHTRTHTTYAHTHNTPPSCTTPDLDAKIRAAQAARGDEEGDRVGLTDVGKFDTDLYTSTKNKFAGYTTEIVDPADSDDDDTGVGGLGGTHPATREAMRAAGVSNEAQRDKETLQYYKETGGSGLVDTKIANREDEYKKRRMRRTLSPERGDAFGDQTPVRTFKDIMVEQDLKNEREQVRAVGLGCVGFVMNSVSAPVFSPSPCMLLRISLDLMVACASGPLPPPLT